MFILLERGLEFAEQHGMQLIDNSELVLDRERTRLAEFQSRERAGFPDLTFAGDDGFSRDSRPRSRRDLQEPYGWLARYCWRGGTGYSWKHAAGTSTGGTLNKAPGRVGDSSLIGCGCYADNLSAAVSLTGWGEPIMKLVLGKWAVSSAWRRAHHRRQAASGRFNIYLAAYGRHGGIILLGPDGRSGSRTTRRAWRGAWLGSAVSRSGFTGSLSRLGPVSRNLIDSLELMLFTVCVVCGPFFEIIGSHAHSGLSLSTPSRSAHPGWIRV